MMTVGGSQPVYVSSMDFLNEQFTFMGKQSWRFYG